jgi:hypothetical protein
MNANPTNPRQQPETEWHGELQEFSGPALSPTDPSIEPRARQGRPAHATHPTSPENDAGDEPKQAH